MVEASLISKNSNQQQQVESLSPSFYSSYFSYATRISDRHPFNGISSGDVHELREHREVGVRETEKILPGEGLVRFFPFKISVLFVFAPHLKFHA